MPTLRSARAGLLAVSLAAPLLAAGGVPATVSGQGEITGSVSPAAALTKPGLPFVPAPTPRLLAGQVIMVGIPAGWSPARPAPLDSIPAGAVILFRRNITPDMGAVEARRLCEEIRSYVAVRHPGVPSPILAIDHEGGRVNRLLGIPGVTPFGSSAVQVRGVPLARAVPRVEAIGRQMGLQLSALGIDLNLAPVVDVVPDPKTCAIGSRSYGADAGRVAALGAAFVRGMRATDTRCCPKHWPGYGPVRPDPHHHVVRARTPPAQWLRTDVPPFRAAVRAGADALMTAHVIYPFLGRLPATVNPRAYARLRDPGLAGIRFEGPILTDDLEMAGVSHLYPNALGRLACDALDAGADMVLVCGKPASALTAYRALVAHAAKHPEAFRARAQRVNRLRGPRAPIPPADPTVQPVSPLPQGHSAPASPGEGSGPNHRERASTRTTSIIRVRDSRRPLGGIIAFSTSPRVPPVPRRGAPRRRTRRCRSSSATGT